MVYASLCVAMGFCLFESIILLWLSGLLDGNWRQGLWCFEISGDSSWRLCSITASCWPRCNRAVFRFFSSRFLAFFSLKSWLGLHKADVLEKYKKLVVGTVQARSPPKRKQNKPHGFRPTDRGSGIDVPYAESSFEMGWNSPYYTASHVTFRTAVRALVNEHLMPVIPWLFFFTPPINTIIIIIIVVISIPFACVCFFFFTFLMPCLLSLSLLFAQVAQGLDSKGQDPPRKLMETLGAAGLLVSRLGPGPWLKEPGMELLYHYYLYLIFQSSIFISIYLSNYIYYCPYVYLSIEDARHCLAVWRQTTMTTFTNLSSTRKSRG